MLTSTLFWELQHNAFQGSSWIAGTYHSSDRKVYAQLPNFLHLMKSCQGFAAELDLSNGLFNPFKGNSSFLLPDGKHLKDYFSKGQYDRMRRIALKAGGIDLERVGYLLPFFLISMITARCHGTDMDEPLDLYLWNYAKKEGMDMKGIETIEEQVDVIMSYPLQQQLRDLAKLLGSVAGFKQKVQKVLEYYQEGDIQQLYRQGRRSLGGMRKKMLFERNHRMADRIFEMISSQNWFIGIGAGHLAGKEGVLRLLKLKGVKVRAFKSDNEIAKSGE